MSNARTAHQRGFNLIELMIVITIIVILAAVVIPAFKRYLDRSRATQAAAANTADAVRLAERSGLQKAEVVGTHNYVSHAKNLGCWAKNDVAYVVEGMDGKEQRVRMTVCCRPGPVCALPPHLSTTPMKR